jgi:hypothetical protein
MEQTAVEWLANEIQEQLKIFFPGATLYQPTIQKAKEMEKEQKKKFFKVGFSQGFASDIISYHKLDDEKEKLFEQYYNETFKSE